MAESEKTLPEQLAEIAQSLKTIENNQASFETRIKALEDRPAAAPGSPNAPPAQAAPAQPTPGPGAEQTVGDMSATQFMQNMTGAFTAALQSHQSGTNGAPVQAPAPEDNARSGGTPSKGNKQLSLANPEQWEDREKYAAECQAAAPEDPSVGILAQSRWDHAHRKQTVAS